MQSPVRRVLAKKAGLTSASTDVLYGGYMGCGWKRWSDEVGIAKLQMLLTAWEETDTTFSKVVRGAVWKMQSEVSARRGFCRGGVASGKRRYAGCPLGGATVNKI